VTSAAEGFVYTDQGKAWKVLGDGCRFQETWTDLDNLKGQLHVQFTHLEAPFPAPMAFVRPHIIGTATKKVTTSLNNES